MNKIFTVVMPDIGEGVVEGEVIQWLKNKGEELKQDEPVVVIMTDKATVELPSPYPGKLFKQYVQTGEIAMKDKPLYDIALLEEGVEPLLQEKAPELKENVNPEIIVTPSQTESITDDGVKAAPPIRKLAKELNIDLNTIKGTGPEGRITQEDLIRKISQTIKETPSEEEEEEEPLVGIPALMAKRMAESKKRIPHFSYFELCDATRLVQLRNRFKEEAAKQGILVTYMPFMIKALSLSLQHYPKINSSYDEIRNSIFHHKNHHVGIAISTKNGLIVPVLKDVQNMDLQETILAYNALKKKALEGSLSPNDMKGATITISNFGVLGGSGVWATPIIQHPEVAILAVAKIQKQPVVSNNELTIKDILNLSWSFDHRIIDGNLAASVSHYFCTLLQNPAALL